MNTNSNWPCKVFAGLLLSAGLMAAAHASDVYVKEDSLGTGQASGSLDLPVGTNNWWTGFQNISVAADNIGTSAMSFAAYCVDPFHYSTTAYNAYLGPSTANNVTTAFAAHATDIQNLFNNYYAGTIGNNANAAAFQLALWEIANDDKNLSTGFVKTNGGTDLTLIANATTLLSNLSYSGPNLYNLTVYLVDRPAQAVGQDYIVATLVDPVPEPESYALMLGGLGVMGFIARRRRKA